MQTAALVRLLGSRCFGIYRDDRFPAVRTDLPLVVNGWLGYRPPDPATAAVFAGVHVGRHHALFAPWLSNSPQPVGVRDPYTAGLLRGSVAVEMIGCATLTFERYRGLRRGRYSIDVKREPATRPLTQTIDVLNWKDEWKLAVRRQETLRRAEIVYTSRLHVVLPCLAFGTPVVFRGEALIKFKAKKGSQFSANCLSRPMSRWSLMFPS